MIHTSVIQGENFLKPCELGGECVYFMYLLQEKKIKMNLSRFLNPLTEISISDLIQISSRDIIIRDIN